MARGKKRGTVQGYDVTHPNQISVHKPDQDQGEKPAHVQRNEGNALETGAQKLHGEAKSKRNENKATDSF